MGKVYIVFYSMYGHIARMAAAIKEGVDEVAVVPGTYAPDWLRLSLFRILEARGWPLSCQTAHI
jgi:hypothetical protein